jgi:hypothetical protein
MPLRGYPRNYVHHNGADTSATDTSANRGADTSATDTSANRGKYMSQ